MFKVHRLTALVAASLNNKKHVTFLSSLISFQACLAVSLAHAHRYRPPQKAAQTSIFAVRTPCSLFQCSLFKIDLVAASIS